MNEIGVSVCTSCQPGEYIPASTDEDSRFRAEQCPVGRYSVAIDSTNCMECPQGTFTNKTGNVITSFTLRYHIPSPHIMYDEWTIGQSLCSSCEAGYFRDSATIVDAYIQCYSCQPGNIVTTTNASICILIHRQRLND